ncbi:EamA family transporter [Sediminibacterium sp.]|uniref:EamA family transporter n=1 Tax=Sediminibacterium sp. TaxID=1917865 RepID=UPI003523F2D1
MGAFFGSFLGLLSFFYSYKYIPASRSSIIQSLKGLFVLIIQCRLVKESSERLDFIDVLHKIVL